MIQECIFSPCFIVACVSHVCHSHINVYNNRMTNPSQSPMSTTEVKNMIDQVEGWYVKMDKEISKEFAFTDFKEALSFVNKVGEIAEKEGHHPNILLYDWNKVRISLSTHSVGGLSEKDFDVAQQVDGQ